MRTGLSFSTATSTMVRKFSSRRLPPTLPGLMRYLASARAHAGILRRAAGGRCSGSRRRSARRRPRSASRSTISGTAAAASSLLTVTRTSCDPARGERRHLVGGRRRRRRYRCWSSTARRPDARDPTGTPPTSAVTVVCDGERTTYSYESIERAFCAKATLFPLDAEPWKTNAPRASRKRRRRGPAAVPSSVLRERGANGRSLSHRGVFGARSSWPHGRRSRLNYSYSTGDRAGYVQKLSKKGWLCKTWEGDLAQVNIPGATQEISSSAFVTTASPRRSRSSSAQVSLSYKEHKGVPRTCFGETNILLPSPV